MYTFELVTHYRLSDAPAIQNLVSIFVLSNFNSLICIAVMSVITLSVSNYMQER